MLDLNSTGMEFASEMVIRAAKQHLDVREFPIEYHPRGGESKLSPMRDGWRHLRLMLVYSPTALFIVPGARDDGCSASLLTLAVFAPRVGLGRGVLRPHADRRVAADHRRHPGRRARALRPRLRPLPARACAIRCSRSGTGGSGSSTGCCSARSCVLVGLDRRAPSSSERGSQRGFGTLAEERLAIVAATAIVAGIQVFFTSFLLSLIGLRRPT